MAIIFSGLIGGRRRTAWKNAGVRTPPVMITVANRTETAARIKYAFDHKRVHIDELSDPARTLHIDSKVLDEAEAAEEPIAEIAADESEEGEDGRDRSAS